MNKIDQQEYEFLLNLNNSDDDIDSDGVKRISELLHSKNSEVLLQATIAAGVHYHSTFDLPLLRLLKDRRPIIRVNACDSLSNSYNIDVLKHIIPLMRYRNPLERGYALMSYSDIVINADGNKTDAISEIKKRLVHERNNWVCICGIEALAQLGDTEQLELLYPYLSDENEHTRRAAIRCSKRFLLQMDRKRLAQAVREQLNHETDPSISRLFEEVLDLIDTSNPSIVADNNWQQ